MDFVKVLEFGLIRVHRKTGEYRYFKLYQNQELFTRPIYVSKPPHMNRLLLRLRRHLNITDTISRQRPITRWYLVL